MKLSDAERATLCEIGQRLGRKALDEVATIARPDIILVWYRTLVARRPPIDRDVEQLIARMAKENPSWGYDRIVGPIWFERRGTAQTRSNKIVAPRADAV